MCEIKEKIDKLFWEKQFQFWVQGRASGPVDIWLKDDTNSEVDFAPVNDGNTHMSNVWVLDIGVFYHMCPRREWFSIYIEVEDGCVKIAHSFISYVVKISLIKIRTHDDNLYTLNGVKHVLSVENNLISVSLFDSRGFKFSVGGRIQKVCEGSDVNLEGVKRGTLYIIQGFTITGLTNSASEEFYKNMTELGHMSERGVQILCGQKRLQISNGLKNYSSEFMMLCKDEEVSRHHTVRDTPEQGCVAEHVNQTLLERAGCMFSSAGLERRFWAATAIESDSFVKQVELKVDQQDDLKQQHEENQELYTEGRHASERHQALNEAASPSRDVRPLRGIRLLTEQQASESYWIPDGIAGLKRDISLLKEASDP
ncbi:hypothetical protein AXX17_AT4G06390 [Arabidopsis thaliana]|uniref:Retrovirus-related Pol polyprotein from transposon TNT 1-94-like beta-barrel domain-containing protein n=1 Tax=Arabidopsis thaliana TaxID=3702 RepID=A0A178V1Z1_ARATH|nr:hypothetical protein AXX17_AT4G06390 [Arabidopsis thaliana]